MSNRFDFEHYQRAGHGRAYLMAKEDPEKYREAIMNACRKDYTFDIQCEGSRAFLTADLINLFDDPQQVARDSKDTMQKFIDKTFGAEEIEVDEEKGGTGLDKPIPDRLEQDRSDQIENSPMLDKGRG